MTENTHEVEFVPKISFTRTSFEDHVEFFNVDIHLDRQKAKDNSFV